MAYCGLDCADCINHKGEIADMARDLRKKLREEKFAQMAPGLSKFFKPLRNYEVCYEVLGAMVRLRCNRACHEGGGNPYCRVRLCCQKKEIDGCWECAEFETCQKMDFLEPIHGDEHLKNLRKLKKTIN
ncbi:MAG: DUF3795 domain-containing protein [Dehalococcoidales bacterium]|nr:DUF3795 domain-containing protein [Dehalococcoidales bacterium]